MPEDRNLTREEVSEIVRKTLTETLADVLTKSTTEQYLPLSGPADKEVSQHENPDEKSTTETVLRTNFKNVGEMPAITAARMQIIATQSLQDAVDYRRKADDQHLALIADEQDARRNHRSRNTTTGTQHDKVIMEVDPVEARSIQELFRTDPEFLAALLEVMKKKDS